MPAIAKRPEDRTRRNKLKHLDQQAFPVGATVPLPPPGLPEDLRWQWGRMWTSPVAQLFDPVSDLPALARLFTLYALGARVQGLLDQAEPEHAAARLIEEGEDDPLMAAAEAASARQAFNSTIGARVRLATEARMLEAQLGLSPRSRLVLGLTVLAGRAAAARTLEDAADDADDDG